MKITIDDREIDRFESDLRSNTSPTRSSDSLKALRRNLVELTLTATQRTRIEGLLEVYGHLER